MSVRVYEFMCPNGHVEEVFAVSPPSERLCETCGEVSERIPSAVRSRLDPISGDFPTAADAWVRKREEKLAQERKSNV